LQEEEARRQEHVLTALQGLSIQTTTATATTVVPNLEEDESHFKGEVEEIGVEEEDEEFDDIDETIAIVAEDEEEHTKEVI
jgi:hypothetical protein